MKSEQLVQSMGDDDELNTTPSEVMQELEDVVENAYLFQMLKQYDETLPQTSLYWRHYMDMVLILLRFIHTERTGDWQMYVSAFLAKLP
jgi:hypothetical protein